MVKFKCLLEIRQRFLLFIFPAIAQSQCQQCISLSNHIACLSETGEGRLPMLNRLIPQFTSKIDLGHTEDGTAITIGTLNQLELSPRLQKCCQSNFELLSGQTRLCQAQY